MTVSALAMLQQALPLSELYFPIVEGSSNMLIFLAILLIFSNKKIDHISFYPRLFFHSRSLLAALVSNAGTGIL